VWKGAIEFLTPVSDISGGAIAINHAHGSGAGVGELMENAVWNINGLAGFHCAPLLAKTHFAAAFDDEIDLFLILVVPRDLAAVGFQSYITQTEVSG
jgi:hypothetical protein